MLTIFVFSYQVQANNVIENLNQFNPQTIFENYTDNPKETAYRPSEKGDVLKSQALNKVHRNSKARDLYQGIQNRLKLKQNSNSPEMSHAEKLLEQSDDVLKGGCYTVKDKCERQIVEKSCHESVSYQNKICYKPKDVIIQKSHQTISRQIKKNRFNEQRIHLTQCSRGDFSCLRGQTIKVSDTCEKLDVKVSVFGIDLKLKTIPSCGKPEFVVSIPKLLFFTNLRIEVTENDSKEVFQKPHCDKGFLADFCILQRSECIDAKQTKLIHGVQIARECWGFKEHYQCTNIKSSNCNHLIEEGCTQTKSTCTSEHEDLCQTYEQTFSCVHETCLSEREVCLEKMPCVDGECNQEEVLESDDFAEGITKLGSLVGVADDVYQNQITSGEASVFRGDAKECKKHPLGIRDCCTDSGWGGWVVHCPKDLQDLARAKDEGRTVYLGSYKNKEWESRHYVYCVFPSKLAGIVQIQGRGAQLGMSYGTAKEPNCSGLTPEQLERIDFSKLNLSALEAEFKARKSLPDDAFSRDKNQNHINSLFSKGRAHD